MLITCSRPTCELTCAQQQILLRSMRLMLSALLLGALAVSGCARKDSRAPVPENAPGRTSSADGAKATAPDKLIVTPESELAGKVVRVNPGGGFVVLSFPLGRVPVLDQHMSVYRRGLKVGEVKISGPRLDENIVGDLVSGDARPGDEVREK